jgi:hypothetical protein
MGPARHRRAEAGERAGKGVRLVGEREAQSRLDAARVRLDSWRQRARLGWRTAAQADSSARSWYGLVERRSFHSAACSAISPAVLGARTLRERRKAERKAILDVAALWTGRNHPRRRAARRGQTRKCFVNTTHTSRRPPEAAIGGPIDKSAHGAVRVPPKPCRVRYRTSARSLLATHRSPVDASTANTSITTRDALTSPASCSPAVLRRRRSKTASPF